MKHIFYLHSNICVISSYDTIVSLIDKHEDVVVISERNTLFPQYNDIIMTYDIEEVIDKHRKKTSNPLLQIINYRCDLIPRYKEFAKEVIENEEFVLYIPSFNMYTIRPFLNNKYCKGYYYIEEGTLSYMSVDSLRKKYLKRRYLQGRVLLDLIGAGETLDYKIIKNFKGCIALSAEAFPWCKDKKQLTGLDGYYSNTTTENVNIEHLIITDYLRSEQHLYVSAFKKIIESVLRLGGQPQIGIKFHPTAYAYEEVKIQGIMMEVEKEYRAISFKLLPSSFSVEALMYRRHLNVYSVFNLSSLLLYSIMLKSKSYMMTCDRGQLSLIPILGMKDFIRISNLA